jgi:hypothetical protein
MKRSQIKPIQCWITQLLSARISGVTSAHQGNSTIPEVLYCLRLPVEDRLGRIFDHDAVLSFYARYRKDGKRCMESLGNDPVEAYGRFQAVEADFARTRSGLLPVHNVTASDSGHVLKDAALEFEEDITSRGLTKRSIDTYRDSIEDFITSCNKLTLEQVTDRDILSFIDRMKANLKTRAFSQPNNTYRNRLKDIRVFFNNFGVKRPLPKKSGRSQLARMPTNIPSVLSTRCLR